MKKIFCLVISILFLISFKLNLTSINNFNTFLDSLNSYGIFYAMFVCVLSYSLYKAIDKNKSKYSLIVSIILSFFMVIGKIYENLASITLLSNIYYLIYFIISFIVYLIVINIYINKLFILFDKLKIKSIKTNKIMNFIFISHPFISMFVFTFIISLIYLIFFYPGTVTYDGFWQLDFYYGITKFTDQHPAMLTIFMGKLMDLGRLILNDNFGIFIYIFIQIIINALVYAYSVKILNKLNSPIVLRIFIFLFYSLFPLLSIYSITYFKDTLYYLVFLFIFIYQYYHLEILKDNKVKVFLTLLIMYLLLFILRQTGFYVSIISLILLIIYNRKNKKTLISLSIILLSIFSFNIYYKNVFLPKNNIEKAKIRFALSIPLQQISRYIVYYENDISKTDKELIEYTFMRDMKDVKKIYDPVNADGIIYNTRINRNKPIEYIKLWLTLFKKHPLIYFDATLNNIYGYFYPDIKDFKNEYLGTYFLTSNKAVNNGYFNIHFNKLKQGRNILENIAKVFINIPLIGMMYSPGLYSWMFIIIFFYLLYKKQYKLLSYSGLLYGVILTMIISAVVIIRYMLPLVVSLPMLIAFAIYELKSKK